MFSFKTILISSLCLIMISFISSTSGGATTIETLKKNTKLIINQVKDLDPQLELPTNMSNFETITEKSKSGIRRIRFDIYYINEFKTEFKKLVDFTKEAVENYTNQINTITNKGEEVGDKAKRDKLYKYYENEILPKLKIEGDETLKYEGDDVVKKLDEEFKGALTQLMDKIKAIKPIENSPDDPQILDSKPTTSTPQEELAN